MCEVAPSFTGHMFLMSFAPPAQILKHKVSLLEASNAQLQHELHARGQICESLKERACDAQVLSQSLVFSVLVKCWESDKNHRVFDFKLLGLTQSIECFRLKRTN